MKNRSARQGTEQLDPVASQHNLAAARGPQPVYRTPAFCHPESGKATEEVAAWLVTRVTGGIAAHRQSRHHSSAVVGDEIKTGEALLPNQWRS